MDEIQTLRLSRLVQGSLSSHDNCDMLVELNCPQNSWSETDMGPIEINKQRLQKDYSFNVDSTRPDKEIYGSIERKNIARNSSSLLFLPSAMSSRESPSKGIKRKIEELCVFDNVEAKVKKNGMDSDKRGSTKVSTNRRTEGLDVTNFPFGKNSCNSFVKTLSIRQAGLFFQNLFICYYSL